MRSVGDITLEDVEESIKFLAPLRGRGPGGSCLHELGIGQDIGEEVENFVEALFDGWGIRNGPNTQKLMSEEDEDFFADFFADKFRVEGKFGGEELITRRFSLITNLGNVDPGIPMTLGVLLENTSFRLQSVSFNK